jgi:hypothetical protein
LSSGRPTGAERSGGAPCGAGHSRQSRGFLHVHNYRRPLTARAGRTRLYAGQRGAHAVWNGPARGPRTRRGRSTGQGLPSSGLSEPGFGSAAALHSPAPRGLAARAGRTRLCAGQRGAHAVRNGPACCRRARRERSAGQGTAVAVPVRPGIFGLMRPNGIASPPPPGAGGKGGAHRSMCGAGWRWDGVCRPAGGPRARRERNIGAGDRHIVCRGRG